MYGLDWLRDALPGSAAGFPFDLIQAAGNLAVGLLILPLSELLKKLNRRFGLET